MRPPTPDETAGYLTVHNRGSVADTLVEVSSPVASMVMIHRQVMANGRGTMEHVAALEIPARGAIVLEPGGVHLMLMGIARRLEVGDTVPLALTFRRGGTVNVVAAVRPYGD